MELQLHIIPVPIAHSAVQCCIFASAVDCSVTVLALISSGRNKQRAPPPLWSGDNYTQFIKHLYTEKHLGPILYTREQVELACFHGSDIDVSVKVP